MAEFGEFLAGTAEFACDASRALSIKIAATEEEALSDEGWFHPEYTHQVFGESEKIVGYAGLSVKLLYSPNLQVMHLGISYTKRIGSGVKADDIPALLGEWIPTDWMASRDDFVQRLARAPSFQPPGQQLHRFSHGGSEYEVYLCQGDTPGLQDYLQRLQPFLVWYIDGASYLDLDDPRWRLFLLFERRERAGLLTYASVGLLSVCEHYAYRENLRPRISQVLILPPFQRKGLGANLLQAVYAHYRGNARVYDVTVEDASPNFTRLRDYVDLGNFMADPSLRALITAAPFTDATAEEIRNKLQLTKGQARRVYEIAVLQGIRPHDIQGLKSFRLAVKQRLYQPFLKSKGSEQRQLARMKEEERRLYLEEKKGYRTQLDAIYQELEGEYQTAIAQWRKRTGE